MARVIRATPLVAGEAAGPVLFSEAPVSFWGGFDAATGRIVEARHPLKDQSVSSRVLVLPALVGSTSSTAVLLEALWLETAPAALVSRTPDRFSALASIVADELYGKGIPVLVVAPAIFEGFRAAARAEIARDGTVRLT